MTNIASLLIDSENVSDKITGGWEGGLEGDVTNDG